MKISLKRLDDAFHFEAKNEDGLTVQMDAAEKTGGHNQGVRPTQLLLMSLAGCSGIDVINILKKQKQQIDDFQAEVEGEQENIQDAAKVFTDIIIKFILKGNIEPQKAKRAVELSMEKYCSVEKTLRLAGAKINHQIILNGESL
ncbi:MAG: OsmC family peroxiredoxin [Bacteroidetes bacterium]|nr:MAG: OsmC family peroxiredoxin [Bacteroidota bacterium]